MVSTLSVIPVAESYSRGFAASSDEVVIGRTRDTLIGRGKVETVDMDVAIAQPVQGSGFQKGDLIRPRTGGAPDRIE